MTRSRWHILDGETLTLARRLPPRFDVAVATAFPRVPRRRLAHQVRQDVWRALQDVRGFSPVIEVAPDGDGLWLTAGGRIDAPTLARPQIESRLHAVLTDPARRERWHRHATRWSSQ